MFIKSLSLSGFRNYKNATVYFDEGTNILFGDNAQGKTNVLESIYMCATTKSHKGAKDKEIVNFDEDEAHITLYLDKSGDEHKIDMVLRKDKSKVVAVNGSKIKKSSELLGLLNVVLFSPEDLSIIKNGPSERRRFIDMELCQLKNIYLYNLSNYNKIVDSRNKLIKDSFYNSDLLDTLNIWDAQLVSYGVQIIEKRDSFIKELNSIISEVHEKLTNGKEKLEIFYEPDVTVEDFERRLKENRDKDIKYKTTGVGPHRDDFSFIVNGIDIRKYGSQGQQRTAALSLKLSEIEIVRRVTGHTPVLLLDDVLSELDSKRQNYLLSTIGDIQTIITCTGLDDFVNDNFRIDKVIKVINGTIDN
ncbi:MAG: DNA replication/repair protein RecF [Lachnospiraceae bacterium]|nr:DNA replication/repair protein RecF [Lachnospiraceae bacterium]